MTKTCGGHRKPPAGLATESVANHVLHALQGLKIEEKVQDEGLKLTAQGQIWTDALDRWQLPKKRTKGSMLINCQRRAGWGNVKEKYQALGLHSGLCFHEWHLSANHLFIYLSFIIYPPISNLLLTYQ